MHRIWCRFEKGAIRCWVPIRVESRIKRDLQKDEMD